jgi:alpha-beta hydrolase superfamily lysophospholipase
MHDELARLDRADLEEYRSKSRFLYGESMGGAVTLLLHRKDPAFWDGAVLVAPMCKVCCKSTRYSDGWILLV